MIYDCGPDTDQYVVKYSQILNLNPVITSTIDIFCITFFCFFRWFKTTWCVQGKNDKIRNIALGVLSLISSISVIIAAFGKETPFIADLLRPFVVLFFLRTLRTNLKEFWQDCKGVSTILIIIFAWIFIYAIVGFYLFRYSFEGVYFESF